MPDFSHSVVQVTVERLFALEKYENVRYGVTARVLPGKSPAELVAQLDALLEQLRPIPVTAALTSAQATLEQYEATPNLSSTQQTYLEQLREQLHEYRQAVGARQQALEQLSRLGGSENFKTA